MKTREQRVAYRALRPSPALAEYVRRYDYTGSRANGAAQTLAATVFPALTFQLNGACGDLEDARRRQTRVRPRAIVVGPCDQSAAGVAHARRFPSFTILFQPTGFYRLFHVSPSEARNRGYDCRDVLGERVAASCSRLDGETCPEEMVGVVEDVLLQARATALPQSRIHWAAQVLLDSNGRADLLAVAKSLGFSDSSWRRHFCGEIGVTPKRYARMLRFRHAIALKRACEARPWTEICLEAGYYDQAHFIADCRALVGSAPCSFMRDLARMPAALASFTPS